MEDSKPAAKAAPSVTPTTATATATTTAPPAKKPQSSTTQQLQQQIQQQLQQQLQAQLQAAAARGQQANITPEQIQAQAQAMVQAAAQAQAVVAAAKSRGDGLVPMNAGQIAALSQIQAQAIVHARTKSQGSAQQIQTQIQLQAQALVHAHTQAQIQAGIYKGDGKTAAEAESSAASVPAATASSSSSSNKTPSAMAATALTPSQLQQQQELKKKHAQDRQQKVAAGSTAAALRLLDQEHERAVQSLHSTFCKKNAAAVYAGVAPQTTTVMAQHGHLQHHHQTILAQPVPSHMPGGVTSMDVSMSQQQDASGALIPQPSSNSPQFLQQLHGSLNSFWQDSFEQIQRLENQTEQDFKNHNDLPLARIKRIMKSDEDVRMISAEAPVLFAKACELFILDLSIRSWNYSQLHKRRTLQKEDVREAIQKTDIFDFLVDVISS